MAIRLLLAALAGCLLALATGHARADEEADRAAADALFREGRSAADAGDYEAARLKFAESQRLDPSAGTLFNLALCEEQLGRVASAWRHYREATTRMKPGDPRASIAAERTSALDPRVPRLILRVDEPRPAGLRVVLDDADVEEAELGAPLLVDPGSHRVIVHATGREPREIAIVLAPSTAETIALTPGPEVAPPRPAPVRPASAAARGPTPLEPRRAPHSRSLEPSGAGRRTAGWVLGGVGGAGIALGAVAGAMVLREKGIHADLCQPNGPCSEQAGVDAARRGSRWGAVSNIAFVSGAVLIAAGVVLVLTSPKTAPSKPAAARLSFAWP